MEDETTEENFREITGETGNETPKKPRGFQLMTPERRREISSQGGVSAHAQGKAHQFTAEEAQAAGRIGGKASAKSRRKAA